MQNHILKNHFYSTATERRCKIIPQAGLLPPLLLKLHEMLPPTSKIEREKEQFGHC